MPLGLMPEMSYEEKETTLHTGEAALLYSDGLVEAHDPGGDMFGVPRLRALIAEHGEKRSLGDLLLQELYFAGERWGTGGRHTPSLRYGVLRVKLTCEKSVLLQRGLRKD